MSVTGRAEDAPRWIGCGDDDAGDADAPRFRRVFALPGGEIAEATVEIAGLGLYELHVNGRKADETRVLAPVWSHPARHVLVDAYDVKALLRPGHRNVLGVWLAKGYGDDFNKWGWRWTQPKRAWARLRVRMADGVETVVVTDGDWEWTRDQPVLHASIYGGEIYDASRADPAWCLPEGSQARWRRAAVLDGDGPALAPNTAPPVRRYDPLKPVAVIPIPNCSQVLDFGQNRAGVVEIRVKAPRGTPVRITCAEEMTDDGYNLDAWTSRAARQQDTYICAGTGDWETWIPRFTYHGFRYAEVSGLPKEAVTPENFTAWGVSADLAPAGSFESSDPFLNWLFDAARRSMCSNFMGYPTDCCMRDERTPCLMDSQCYEEAAMQVFDMRAFYLKWLDDVLNYSTSYDGHNRNPDWEGDGISLAHRLWLYCGCRDEIRARWQGLLRLAGHFAARLEAGGWLWPDGGFGDWCAPAVRDADGSFKRDVVEVNTILAAAQFGWMADMAADLGFADDADRFASLRDRTSARYREAFLGGDALASLVPDQTVLAMPLALGLVPDADVPAVRKALARRIRERDGGRIDTGIYGTRYLGDALMDGGEGGLWLAMLKGPAEPSFGYMRERGATTLWEQWAYHGWMHSHNHAMMTGCAATLFTRLAGIRPLKPGYAEGTVKPIDIPGVDSFKVVRETPRGRIEVSMSRGADGKPRFDIAHDGRMTLSQLPFCKI